MREHPLFFPRQKIPTGKKNREWYKQCVDSAEMLAVLRADSTAEQHRKMFIWEDLDNDIINEGEIEKVFNPMQLTQSSFPASIKNYPLSVPKLDLLQGEELKRRFDWSVMAKNEDAYSNYSKNLRDEIIQAAITHIQQETPDQQQIEQRIQEISKYFKYEFKDLNELAATRVLQNLWRQQDLKEKFSSGFRDALVKGVEIYRVDNVGGEPFVVKTDPKYVYTIRKGNSHRIEDADIIVEIGYEPIGKVIDEFYDYLTPSEIDDIEKGYESLRGSSSAGILQHKNTFPRLYSSGQIGGDGQSMEDLVVTNSVYNLPYDYEGNVRVVRVRWKGRRRLGVLTYFDEMTGDQEERLVSERYKVNEELGETVKWIWVNEAYEGHRIADDKYIKFGPRDVQMRHFDNPSKCFLGYVGTDYGKSLMGRMESYQYLYNVYMRRLELAIAKYKGPIYELDITKKPEEWDVEQWMYYAEVLGWAVVDPFNEGKKGTATGVLSGHMNTTGKVLDADVGNYIQQLVLMLQYIETQMGQIAGVTAQREGQVDNRETVGGVERAVTQSSHTTEKWFFVHDETKKRVLLALLDTAKQIWKNSKSKKLGFILDDMSRQMIDFNGEDFASTEYDLFITNSSDDLEIRQSLKQLAQAAVQNGASLTLPITILRSDSITDMARKIETAEQEKLQREEQMNKETSEANERMQQAQLQDKQADRDLEYYRIDTDNQTKLQIAGMKDNDEKEELPEDHTADFMKLDLDNRKLNLQETKQNSDATLKERDLRERERHNRAAEGISRRSKSKV